MRYRTFIENRIRPAIIFLGLMAVASAFRFPQLDYRPMHADEAVHADQFGTLLEQGRYEYSPTDFHGPTLYYVTLVPAWMQGIRQYTGLSEVMLRSVTAAAGVFLVGAHFFLVPYLGLPAAAWAGLLTALSPAMVYYSRDYIHEMLLVFLTLCLLLFCFQYSREQHPVWAAGAGAFLGLMYATKETTVIAAGCMLLAALLTLPRNAWREVNKRHVAVAAATGMGVAVFLITAALRRPRGILDSVLAYGNYFARASGSNTLHVHPWNYYLGHLIFYHTGSGPVWTEALIVLLAVCGVWAAFRPRALAGSDPVVLRFLAVYALLMVGIYSLMPYKAPWNLLGFLHGLILLAGIGAAVWLDAARHRATKLIAASLLVAGMAHLGWQAWASSIRFSADPRNPWVYAQTGKDVSLIVGQLQRLAAAYPGGLSLPVSIISRENLWPLPWYLRGFPGARWAKGVPATMLAPVILTTPDMESAIAGKLYDMAPPGQREMYVSMFTRHVDLRPGVELRGYVTKSLWDECRGPECGSGPL
jgi:uncharacterized protein (TIGR03663 family)